MKKYLYDPPLILKKLFRKTNWNTPNNKILLSFDDGPIPQTTESILKLLNNYNIKAMFFCVGNNISKYPELARNILENGHSIGNHTYNHQIPTKLSSKKLVEEISMFNCLMHDNFNYNVEYFRPPHGRFDLKTLAVIKEHKLKNVMWSLLTYDYKNNINIVKFAVNNFLTNSSIVVLHDSIKSSGIILDSIKMIVHEAYKKGFEFGAPEECLR